MAITSTPPTPIMMYIHDGVIISAAGVITSTIGSIMGVGGITGSGASSITTGGVGSTGSAIVRKTLVAQLLSSRVPAATVPLTAFTLQ